MSSPALDGSRKKLATLVRLTFNRDSLESAPTSDEVLYYCDGNQDYNDGSQTWTNVPTLSVKVPPFLGTVEQGLATIELPKSIEVADLLSNGEPFPPVGVWIAQDVAQLANDPDAVPETKRLILFTGRVHKATRNLNSKKNLVRLDVAGAKSRLNTPLGLVVGPTCGWTFARATRGRPNSYPADITDLAAYWTFDADDRSNPTSGNVRFTDRVGSLDLYNSVSGTWGIGSGVWEDRPSQFNQSVSMSGNSGLSVGGIEQTPLFAFAARDFSISFWWKSSASGTEARHAGLVTKTYYDSFFGPSGNVGWAIYCPAGTRDLAFYSNSGTLYAAGALVHDSDYHHIVVRRIGSAWSMWVDGVQVDTDTNAAAIDFSWTPAGDNSGLFVSDHGTGGVHSRWKGHYDDLGIWDGHGLTNDEIAAIYNGGVGEAIFPLGGLVGCTIDPLAVTMAGAGAPENLVQERTITAINGTEVTLGGLTAPGSVGNGNVYEMGYLRRGSLTLDIRAWDRTNPGVVHLRKKPPAWWLNETVNVFPGCDGQHATCRDRWDNEVDFGGFGIRMPNYSATHEVQ